MSAAGRFLFASLLLSAASPLSAQFQVHSWDNFESGAMAPGTLFVQFSSPANTKVVDYATLGDSALTAGAAKRECGRYGLEVRSDRQNRFLGLVSPVILNRKLLGERGRALFQADIFVRPGSGKAHTVALAAYSSLAGSPLIAGARTWTLYRFGAMKDEKAFFSFTNDTPQPRIYFHQDLSAIAPPEAVSGPGWHRFQMVIEGQSAISCYVDGRPTSFSPVSEDSFGRLQPGILATAPENDTLVAYVDNIAIQWTADASTPMPESPWLPSSMAATTAGGAEWSLDGDEVLAASRTSGRPALALFYSPFNVASQELINNLLPNTPEAAPLLAKFHLLRADVNQLQGGTLARKYAVHSVPTLVVLRPDGTEVSRMTAARETRWADIAPLLEAAVK